MKKSLKFLFLLASIVIFNSSCKKEETGKELLTSGKWYYDFVDNLHNTGNHNCFNETDYIEFRTDGTISASRLGDGNYLLSEDGKSVTITFNNNMKEEYAQWKGTIHLIKENYLRMSILAIRDINQDYGYEITFAKNRTHQYCYQN